MDLNVGVLFYFTLFFLISVLTSTILLFSFGLKKSFFFTCMLLSIFGHFVGGFLHAWISATIQSSDTVMYFNHATPKWGGMGTGLMENIAWYLRSWIFGNSFYGAYSFSIFIGILGSMLYLICLHKLVLRFDENNWANYNFRNLRWGYLLISCLPSMLFWTSIFGKDSIVYFCSALLFLSLVMIVRNKVFVIPLLFAAILAFMIRPYLLLVGVFGCCFWLLSMRKHYKSFFFKILLFCIIIILFISVADIISEFGQFKYSYESISDTAMRSQSLLAAGSHIPVPTDKPYLLIWFLPYTMFCNLFLPLFFWIRNIFGVMASLQNVLLVILCYQFIKHRKNWLKIKSVPLINYMFWYFITGIGFLGILNTNLGLADREKLMYLPVFLIIIILTISIKRHQINKITIK